MKIHRVRNTALGLTGLVPLILAILACTSFSPDDTKVLYPAFSGANGAVGFASYDRKSKRSELVFVSANLEGAETNDSGPNPLRAQWLGDVHRILATWTVGRQEDLLNLAVFPFDAHGAVQLFSLPGKELSKSVMLPAPIVGDRAFLIDTPNQVARLDLRDGTVVHHPLGEEGSDWLLYPAADGQSVFYLEDRKSQGDYCFGRLDPQSFALTTLLTFTNRLESGFSFTYDGPGNRLVFVEKAEAGPRLVVLERGKPEWTRPLSTPGGHLELGNLVISRGGDLLLASFRRTKEGSSVSAFGLIEIPLREGSARETVLIPACKVADESAAAYFQFGVSHDGKTAAVASTYLACVSQEFKGEDCALFLVDLSGPNRKVTKVPIALPSRRATSAN